MTPTSRLARLGAAMLATALAPAALAPAATAASLTPPNLGAATTLADQDLFVVWPNASGGPLEAMQWSVLRAQIATGLGSTWLLPANNLSELTSLTAARSNLGLGTAATANTGTSGATVPLLNGANGWSGAQTMSLTSAGAIAYPLDLANTSGTAGSGAGLFFDPGASGLGVRGAAITAENNGSNAITLRLKVANGAPAADAIVVNPTRTLTLPGYGAGLLTTDSGGNVGSAAIGTSGHAFGYLDTGNVWSALQTVATASASGLTENFGVENNAADAAGDQAGLDFIPSSGACPAIISGYRDGSSLNTGVDIWTCSGFSRTIAFQLDHTLGALFVANVQINGNTTLGNSVSNTVTVNAAALTRPSMPAFEAKLSVSASGVTGDATQYIVAFNTAVFDRHGDFNTGTGTFTVPFTGLYLCRTRLTLTGLAADNNRFDLQISASVGQSAFVDAGKLAADANGRAALGIDEVLSLTAGATVTVRLGVEGHASKNIGVLNDGAGGSANPASTFSCVMEG